MTSYLGISDLASVKRKQNFLDRRSLGEWK
jgi:hypothetical protein